MTMKFVHPAVILLLFLVVPTTPFSPFYAGVVKRISHVRQYQSPSFELTNLFQDTTRIRVQKEISPRSFSSSSLGLFPASAIANAGLLPVARTTAILGVLVAFLLNWKRILWPKATTDPHYADAPLPPGSLGCPFFGNLWFLGSKEHGVNHYWYKMLNIMKGASIWKTYFLGQPMAVVTGGKRITSLLNQEFHENGIQVGVQSEIMGKEHLLGLTDGKMHSFMRKLVGSAMTPAACNAAVPNLQELSEKQAQKMIQQGQNITMREVCTDFTLDVAWRQILGLDLKDEDEIQYFYKMVDTWIMGFADIRNRLNLPGTKQTKGYKAREYIVTKIEEKIDSLIKNGPDETTMSGMVYATDDDGSSKKLTRQQVIDNALLLILAGSETSASTLTNAMLFLGLNRDAWDKLVEEQRMIQAKYGDKLQREILEKECPYLEGVIKEAMRIRPLPSAAPRQVKATKVIDGFQIPKGWTVLWTVILTHIHDPVTYKEDLSHMDPREGFKPERWMDKKTRPSDDFIPMGAGSRYCLGSTLAYTEMKVFLAVLARKIDFKLVKDPEEALMMKRVSIIPLPADGVVVDVWSSQSASSPISEFSQNATPSLKI